MKVVDLANFQWPRYRLPLEEFKTDFGIGIVGYGGIVQSFHMPAYRLAGYNVVAAADIKDTSRNAAVKAGIPNVFEDYRDLLKMDEVHIIDLSVAHSPEQEPARIEIVQAAAEAGKHILIHKPFATTMDKAERMVRTAEENGVSLAVNQNARFDPPGYMIKGLLSPDYLGSAATVEVANLFDLRRIKPDADKGSNINWLIHQVDLIRWWIDREPASVYAVKRYGGWMLIITFDGGPIAYESEIPAFDSQMPIRIWADGGAIAANLAWNPWAPDAPPDSISVKFSGLVRDNDSGESLPLFYSGGIHTAGWISMRLPRQDNAFDRKRPYYDVGSPYAGMMGVMGDFMQAIHERRPALTDARDNLNSLRLALAAEESAASNRVVML